MKQTRGMLMRLLGFALIGTSCATLLNVPELPSLNWLIALSILTGLLILLDW
ncbi:MAG: hypothetical protein ACRDH2_09375 [Anaerolineales bacterium]